MVQMPFVAELEVRSTDLNKAMFLVERNGPLVASVYR